MALSYPYGSRVETHFQQHAINNLVCGHGDTLIDDLAQPASQTCRSSRWAERKATGLTLGLAWQCTKPVANAALDSSPGKGRLDAVSECAVESKFVLVTSD